MRRRGRERARETRVGPVTLHLSRSLSLSPSTAHSPQKSVILTVKKGYVDRIEKNARESERKGKKETQTKHSKRPIDEPPLSPLSALQWTARSLTLDLRGFCSALRRTRRRLCLACGGQKAEIATLQRPPTFWRAFFLLSLPLSLSHSLSLSLSLSCAA